MQVLVMRHGPALEREDWPEDDAARPLSKEGARKTRAAARGLKYLSPHVDLVASSPLQRAAQTAEIAHEELEVKREAQAWFELALLAEDDADLAPLVARLARLQASASTCILLVGHEPGCSRLVSLLLCGDAGAIELDWKKAGVACLEVEGERVMLKWLASPKMLRGLARTAGR